MFTSVIRRAAQGCGKLSHSNLNPHLRQAEYAVRGALVLRAGEIEKQIAGGSKDWDFSSIVYCNIGNPQQLGQKPITFGREVLALVSQPSLIEKAPKELFSTAARDRAEEILSDLSYKSTGQYTHSLGLSVVRRHVKEYIERRDGGIAADPERIGLSDGASPSVKNVLNALIRNDKDAILTPVPQYPLYSASIALFGGAIAPYYLDFDNSWGISVEELRKSVKNSREAGLNMRALVVINPGNPTGACLDRATMDEVVKFCEEEELVLLADEVYQDNVYVADRPFHSFKKVVSELGSSVPLFSFHSTSKGFMGECGRRGGYMEAHNIPSDVWDEMYKLASVSLCSNVDGQVMVSCMVKPPAEGSDAHGTFLAEKTHILDSLARRAQRMVGALNEMEGVSCNDAQGAMYVHPRITLPQKFVEEALKEGKQPDAVYCMRLLEATGVCVVPGSGFHQLPGTYHFRSTFLPQDHEMEQVIERMGKFHRNFMAAY